MLLHLLQPQQFQLPIYISLMLTYAQCYIISPSNDECGMAQSIPATRQPRLFSESSQDRGSRIEYKERRYAPNANKSNQVPRLINGQESSRGAWPWQVSLQLLHPKFGLIKHWCGGVLIYPSWILTAAHCIHNEIFSLRLAALWTAVLGDWDRDVEENTEIRIPVENIYIHEQFHNYMHDIALLKLSRAADRLDRGIGTVCLPSGPEIAETSSCIATGWGKTTPKGPLSATLRQIRVPLLNNTICKTKYGSTIPIQSSHLCGGKLDGKFGTCIGDSGGPLQCTSQDGRWFLAGLTSFGSGCAKPGYPDVYTKLSFYVPWIKQQIEKHSHDSSRF